MTKQKIINGDCIQGLSNLAEESIDCVWTDPPYNINYHYEGYDDNLSEKEYWDMIDNVLAGCYKVLKIGKVMFMKQFWKNWYLSVQIALDKGFKLHNVIIWKNSSPAQPNTNYKPIYEVILMFTKGDIDYFDDKFETRKTIMPWNKSRLENYFGKITNLWTDIPNIYAGSIKHKEGIYKDGTNEKAHPAQHPIKLVTRCIGFVTKEEDVVLDPFIGSGTTAVACKQLNRQCIGYEINPEYCKIAEERLSQKSVSDFWSNDTHNRNLTEDFAKSSQINPTD